jgi:eukaryotic-like serine/threonine-protein kinase
VLRLQQWSRRRASAARPLAEEGAPATSPEKRPAGVEGSQRYLILDEPATGTGTVRPAYDTLLDRKVALRFLARSGSEPELQARVMREATAMARLSHPGVITVHDVGVQDGVPYLATELVGGVALAVWREQAAGPAHARRLAQVMAAAARGLAAAHRAGVVHRDVNPHAIVVADERVVVTDFGASAWSEGTAGSGQPAYPTPEQLRGEVIDRRADVFAFCATLYQMIHGKAPFAGMSSDELAHLGQLAEARLEAPPQSRALARLHRLALRGLHPDPARRPADLDRLADELLAVPGRGVRNAALAAAAVAVVAVAFWVGGRLKANPEQECRAGADAIAGSWNDTRRSALRQHYLAVGVAAAGWPVLERMMDGYADSWRAMYGQTCSQSYGKRVQTDQVFDQRIDCLEARRAGLDSFVATLTFAPPQQLIKAGSAILPEIADCGIAGRLQTKPLPSDPQVRAQIADLEKLVAQAEVEQTLGEYRRAEVSASRAVEAGRKLGYEPLLAAALARRASIAANNGSSSDKGGSNDLDQATRLFEEAFAVAERGRDDRQRLVVAREQVILQTLRQHFAEGERWARLAEALLVRMGNPALDECRLASNLGWLRKFEGKREAAATAFKRSVEAARRMVPVEPRRLQLAQSGVCVMIDDVAERIACCRHVLEAESALYGPEHPELASSSAILAEALVLRKETHAEACTLFRKVLAIRERTIDRSHPNTINVMTELAQCLAEEGQFPQAQRLLEEVIARKPGSVDVGFALDSHAYIQFRHGDLTSAVTEMRAALASVRRPFEPINDYVMYSRANVADVLIHAGQTGEAQRVLQDGLDDARKAKVMTGPIADLRARQGTALLAENHPQSALRAFEDALRLHQTVKTPEDKLAYTLNGLGTALLELGRIDSAGNYLERAFAVRPDTSLVDGELRADITFARARFLAARAHDRQRPCGLVREAVSGYRQFRNLDPKIKQGERWLARHRCNGT